MRIIDRYILRQVIVTTLFAVIALSAVLVVGNILQRLLNLLVNRDIPLEEAAKFIGYLLPFSLTFTIPWGFLTAVLLVIGRLSADNEITALRSLGFSMQRLFFPLLLLGVFFSGVSFWLNGYLAPHAQGELVKLPFNLATKTPGVLFESDHVITEFPGRKIYVGKKEADGSLSNVTVFETDGGQPIRIIFAKRGILRPDPVAMQLVLVLQQSQIEEWTEPGNPRSVRAGITIEDADAVVPLDELYERAHKKGGVGTMQMPELRMALHSPDTENVTVVRTEINRRMSVSLGCLAFALVAIPLGITAQRKETSIGFGISLIVAFTYFIFIIAADNFRENAAMMPHLLMWIPNVLFLTIGTVMFWRLCRK